MLVHSSCRLHCATQLWTIPPNATRTKWSVLPWSSWRQILCGIILNYLSTVTFYQINPFKNRHFTTVMNCLDINTCVESNTCVCERQRKSTQWQQDEFNWLPDTSFYPELDCCRKNIVLRLDKLVDLEQEWGTFFQSRGHFSFYNSLRAMLNYWNTYIPYTKFPHQVSLNLCEFFETKWHFQALLLCLLLSEVLASWQLANSSQNVLAEHRLCLDMGWRKLLFGPSNSTEQR